MCDSSRLINQLILLLNHTKQSTWKKSPYLINRAYINTYTTTALPLLTDLPSLVMVVAIVAAAAAAAAALVQRAPIQPPRPRNGTECNQTEDDAPERVYLAEKGRE
jgi:hypothetical protein